jgi:hypothetical protein
MSATTIASYGRNGQKDVCFSRVLKQSASRGRGGLVGPPCSRNPHDETVVVRRVQSGTKPGHPLKQGNERAWKNHL